MAMRRSREGWNVVLVAKSHTGRVTAHQLAPAANEREARAIRHQLERRLKAAFPMTEARDGWVSIYLEEDGDWADKESAGFEASLAQARKVLGGRVLTNGRAPHRGVQMPASKSREHGRWEVLVETAKGTGRKVLQAGWARTKDEAERMARKLLARIEADVKRYGEQRDGGKVRVEVVNAPTRQITEQSRWVRT